MAEKPSAAPESWTIQKLLDATRKFLQQRGIEEPRLDAEILLAHVLACPRIALYTRFEEPIDEPTRAILRELVRRRSEGCPVAYLVGYREFYKLRFEVTPDVLIPRPDTEHLLIETLKRAKGYPQPRILDIGTGSGCLAVSLAHQLPSAGVSAVDLSLAALTVAKRNAARHGVAERIAFFEGDLFAPLPAGMQFEIIVSNPPYIAAKEFPALPRDVRDFEPRMALDGGPDGLAVYRRLIATAANFIVPMGWLLLEIGSTQEDSVRQLFAPFPQWSVEPTVRDLGRLPRVIVAKYLG